MTIKRGLKRIWIMGSVLWIVFELTLWIQGAELGGVFRGITVVLGIWWAIYWVISGFFSDEDKSD